MAASQLPASLTTGGHPARAAGRRRLTPRQAEVATKLGVGLSDTNIAQELCISESTVKKHIKDACARMGLNDRAALVGVGLVYGEIPLVDFVHELEARGLFPVGQGEPGDCAD